MKEIQDGTEETRSHWKNFALGKPIVLVDFDHTITKQCLACHDYEETLDSRTVQEGVAEALRKLAEKYYIIIFTGNANARNSHIPKNLMRSKDEMAKFLRTHNIPFDDIQQTKPPACFIIDDRAIHHTSWKHTMEEIDRREKM